MLTQAELKQALRYDRRTGAFYWRVHSRNTVTGAPVGSLCNGYQRIGLNKKYYLAHRLAWLYVYGYFPKQLDHKNRNRSDNRITNLREANNSQNQVNALAKRGNLRGTYKYYRRWRARIRFHGRMINLGTFATSQAAHTAYCHAAKKLHGEFF